MKLELILIILISLCVSSCDKNDDINDFGYPDGITVVNMESTNDCSLDKCSNERIVRLQAKDVEGQIVEDLNGDFALTYAYSFDSSINFYFCDLPDNFKQDGLDIVFSGDLIDACGVKEAVWPVEEVYLIKLTKIEKQ